MKKKPLIPKAKKYKKENLNLIDHDLFDKIHGEIKKTVVGQEQVIKEILITVFFRRTCTTKWTSGNG